MHFHSNEKLKSTIPSQPHILKTHYIKNASTHTNAETPLNKPPEPTMTLKLLEAKINHNSSKSSEMSLFSKVIYGSQEWNTNVENVSNYNPKWQEVFAFIYCFI